ncbi:hypothetical protein PHLCEN_2v3487 [Hermanssonia centrifuga]|uniref:Uncharacterized protein n=1 Tax=Hermanssonia centrifuga TaxID=98765 RepID=A0A2R6QF13_9APHY|nr:hypothetical protein PHLCEN_2v3487 [Hermanssonia centrifuga]
MIGVGIIFTMIVVRSSSSSSSTSNYSSHAASDPRTMRSVPEDYPMQPLAIKIATHTDHEMDQLASRSAKALGLESDEDSKVSHAPLKDRSMVRVSYAV